MQADPVNIKVLRAAGTTIPAALKAALGYGGVGRFARRHGFRRPNVSSCINGLQRHERIRATLAAEVGVDRDWLDAELDRYAGRHAESSSVPSETSSTA